MTTTIPTKVIRDAQRWLDRVTVQAHPRMDARRPDVTVLLNGQWVTRTRRPTATRAAATRARIGDACRFALYAWKHDWTEERIVQATAELTRLVDARRKRERAVKQRKRDRERRESFAAAIARRRRSGKDVDLEATLRELEQWADGVRKKQKRSRVDAVGIRTILDAPRSLTQNAHAEIDWQSIRKLHGAAMERLEALCLPARPSKRAVRPVQVPGLPMQPKPVIVSRLAAGKLEALAAHVNGRRI